mmetsp:Transcript_7637/g.18392  ORF Transcript_7637/g.18392 Transcript_7637/m.18392 type:complete len:97 (-) Transcript_7637:1359-1649(-)
MSDTNAGNDSRSNSLQESAMVCENKTEKPERKNTTVLTMQKIEWLGQTAASIFWIISVFAYGIESTGDWLQLAAACSWFGSNVAAAVASAMEETQK